MPSLLERGQTFINRKAESSTAETVRVTRKQHVLNEAWLATPAINRLETLIDGQLSIMGDRCDWLGDPAGWQLDGAATCPMRGDVIEWARPGYTILFEALPADGEGVSAPAGRFDNRMRVHTKVIGRQTT